MFRMRYSGHPLFGARMNKFTHTKNKHDVLCLACGRVVKSDQVVRNWNGQLVCLTDKEENPYKYLRNVKARRPIPADQIQMPPPDRFVDDSDFGAQ
jgi:hypothetical protein